MNVACKWNITLPNPKLVLEILFNDNSFGIAGKMPKCKKDWVKVYGLDANDTVISTWGPFCDYATPPTILTKTSIARVEFYAGRKHGRSRKGFQVHYQALEVCISLPPPLSVKGKTTKRAFYIAAGNLLHSGFLPSVKERWRA